MAVPVITACCKRGDHWPFLINSGVNLVFVPTLLRHMVDVEAFFVLYTIHTSHGPHITWPTHRIVHKIVQPAP
jgi:hypothetical protein